MPATLQTIYSEREKKFSNQLNEINRRINLISNLRLAAALLIVIAIYLSFSNQGFIFLALMLVIVLVYFIQQHATLFFTRTHLENLVRINSNEQKALKGQFSEFDAGYEFVDPHHMYSHDLDIFGEGSLFQYISRCNTVNGRKHLAHRLENPQHQKEKIVAVQHSLRDVCGRIEFRQHFQASGMEIKEQSTDYQQLMEWTSRPSLFANPKNTAIILWLVPSMTLASLTATFFIPQAKLLLFALILCQWLITGSKLKKINVFHDYISRKKNILQKYSRLLFHLEQENFKSGRLSELKHSANEAHVRMNRLASLVSALDARTNAMTTFVVNSLLLFDLQCVFRLEKWKEENADKLRSWLDAITEIEVLNSFGTFAFNNPSFSFAEITTDLKIAATDVAHPLISEHERVFNDIQLGPESTVMIVTGANMAGKSTFLRTIGVNMILALNGAPVCAAKFVCPIIQIRSGMRTADSLKDHQSYFYAELNRLKSIMDELRSDKPVLILLDEILKGTNSNDKQAGSIALVRQLLPHPCLAIIATHDLALGELEKEFPRQIKNYCFEANIDADQLSFDYKLKTGVAQKMNASFLMRKMGIIPG
jgi:DNA mismatch repair ATPase MutS